MSLEPSLEPHAFELLDVARSSVEHGLEHGKQLRVEPRDYPAPLREERACFVTLNRLGRLRGCIGTLEARRPLIEDLAANAYKSAFEDPRFAPLVRNELDGLDIEVSVLSTPEPMNVQSEAELIAGLEPGVDGLVIDDGRHRATFLPKVWKDLQRPEEFLEHLWAKAGLDAHQWSPNLRCYRYRAENFSNPHHLG
ncbi:MAG: AmmeMemoRadiSam system protein A [Gammaproteobacteria bacterium]|nr:AmmeMemoRadiSam system protein A [Gammaproteobacteria bacterium]